jgi:DNA-binding PucR family transcriptional regulator
VMTGGLGGSGALEHVRRIAREKHLGCLCAVQGDRLVVILGGVDEIGKPAAALAEAFAKGPVVIGPVTESLSDAKTSADAAHFGLRVACGWPDRPRPVLADDLLPERALAGDLTARATLVDRVFTPLHEAGSVVLETVEAYLSGGSSIEGTARALFVHANTVRYRLRRAADLTSLEPADPRDSYTLRVGLTLGRLDAAGL